MNPVLGSGPLARARTATTIPKRGIACLLLRQFTRPDCWTFHCRVVLSYCLSWQQLRGQSIPTGRSHNMRTPRGESKTGFSTESQLQLLRLRMVIYGLERRLDSCVSMASDSFHGSRRVEKNCRYPTLPHSSVRAMGVYGSERLPG